MHTYKLTLCYDGGRYSGWQRQGNTDNTIQARVEAALGRALGTETEAAGSGRTDAGVHARAQACSFHTEHTLDCAAALEALREALPEDIGARPRRVSMQDSAAVRRPMSTACGTAPHRMFLNGGICTASRRSWT